MSHKIAFNTANLVARVSGYRFDLKAWGEQDRLTRQRTDEREWAAICAEIAAAGYKAVEVWVAHVDPPQLTDVRARQYARIMSDHGLTPIGLAAPLTADTARVCGQLGIPACNGGLWGTTLDEVRKVIDRTGVAFNYENHPEKSVAEIVRAIDGGGPKIGVAVDTGWLGTQGVDAPQAVRELGPLVRHVHLKEVTHTGSHATCPLGQGAVNIVGVIAALKEVGYTGWYSWEDEPEDRNPMDIAADMRKWIEAQLG